MTFTPMDFSTAHMKLQVNAWNQSYRQIYGETFWASYSTTVFIQYYKLEKSSFSLTMCCAQKISILTPRMVIRNSDGVGIS